MSATLPTYCVGQKTYVVAVVPDGGSYAFVAQNVPVLWLGGEIPSYSGIVATDGSISILSGVDIRSFVGTQIFVGCGTSTDDLLTNRKYSRLLNIGSSSPAPRIFQVGEQSVGQNKSPDCALQVGDSCWQKAVADGTVKMIASQIELTGYSTRQVMFASYVDISNDGCLKMVYADDGSIVGVFPGTPGGPGCKTSRIGWAVGTEDGIISFFPDFDGGVCTKSTWDQNRFGLNVNLVTCPFPTN
jgi:hypothetical protein